MSNRSTLVPALQLKPLFYRSILLMALILLLSSCEQPPSQQLTLHTIGCRNCEPELDRPLIYRASTPLHWLRKDPNPTESIADTKKSICEFFIQENSDAIRITLHTFPFQSLSMRIPPQAQIHRWKKQFEELDPLSCEISPASQGGYTGLFFEGQGMMQGSAIKVMGWSMQVAPMYARQLIQSHDSLDQSKCADYTIKIVGPPSLLEKNRADLLTFAHSFELIDELPYSP